MKQNERKIKTVITKPIISLEVREMALLIFLFKRLQKHVDVRISIEEFLLNLAASKADLNRTIAMIENDLIPIK